MLVAGGRYVADILGLIERLSGRSVIFWVVLARNYYDHLI
jgi:hypothetical protein